MDFADKAENINVQNHFFDAQRQILLKQDNMQASFHSALRKVMDDSSKLDKKTEKVPGQDELTLLNKEIYEKNLALQTLTDHAERANYQQLYSLSQRLSVIRNCRPQEFEDLPASPQSVTHAFTQALEHLSIENDTQLVIYTLYDKYVLSQLTEIYDALNEELIEAGILPTLKYQLKKSADVLGEGSSHAATEEQTETAPETNAKPETEINSSISAGEYPTTSLADETMGRICNLLTASRNSTHVPRAPLPEGVSLASNVEVAQAFKQAETAPETALPREVIYGNSGETIQVNMAFLKRVRSLLVDQRQNVKTAIGHDRLNDNQEDVIDVVGMLFESMLDDNTLPGTAKALLGHLHTPYIKYALKNSEFLNSPSHPARVFFSVAVDGGSVWVDEQDLNTGIYPVLKNIVGEMVRHDNLDKQVFEECELQLSEKIAQLDDKSKMTETRSTDAEKGRAKLEYTKELARQTTSTIFGGKEITLECKRFIDSVWLDYLILVLLRDKGDATWKKAESLGNQILQLDQRATGDQNTAEDIGSLSIRIMEEIGTLLPQKSSMIDRFLTSLERKGAATIAMQTDRVRKEHKEIEASLQVICENLRTLSINSRVEFRPLGAKKYRAKLAWYNPHSENFLFVGNNGQKVALKEIKRLAQEVNDGTTVILPHHESSFFDRAMTNIKSLLESAVSTDTKKQQMG